MVNTEYTHSMVLPFVLCASCVENTWTYLDMPFVTCSGPLFPTLRDKLQENLHRVTPDEEIGSTFCNDFAAIFLKSLQVAL